LSTRRRHVVHWTLTPISCGLVALANRMRLSLMKAAHAAMDGATCRKSGSQFTI
jgi:hypothetical protein